MDDENRNIVLQAKDIHKSFYSPTQVCLLKGVNLTVYQGDTIAIMGRSGEGKSTLLHILGTLEKPCNGSLEIAGQNISHCSTTNLRNKKLALGSEVMFIFVQKYKIGHWCPICLSIAASLALTALMMVLNYFIDLNFILKQGQKGQFMKSIFKGSASLIFFVTGFLLAYFGVAKFDKLHAEESTIGKSIVFGTSDSKIEVYVVTDWLCPACRALEPTFEKMSPEVMKKAKLYFIDFPIHEESLNFIPFNLSFMIHNKEKYFELRNALTAISKKTSEPTEEDVQKAIKPLGVKYTQLNYADVAVGIKYFKHLVKQLGIEATPTVVVINKDNKKGKKLKGSEITEKNVMNAIDSLSKP